MREDCLIVQQIALLIQTDNLAAGSESRVDCKGTLLTDRSRKQKLLKVLAKDSDGLYISPFFSFLVDFI